ncbi:MAG: hypothetical protein SFW35_09550 [Chitinophagales bacterium]|nr:hypothetical protein [Chitinophagales bacterium]
MSSFFKVFQVVFALSVAIILVGLQGCQKDPEPSNELDPNMFNEMVCDGGGDNTWYPLAVGNSWRYDQYGSFNYVTRNVEATVPFAGKLYYIVVEEQSGDDFTVLLGEDSIGNIVQYSGNTEYLYIPKQPVINKTWYNGGDSLKVVAVDTTLDNRYCSYTNVLAIEQRDAGNTLKSTRYYVKGIGQVYATFPLDSGNHTLSDIALE